MVGLFFKFNSFAPNCTAPDVTIRVLTPCDLSNFTLLARDSINCLLSNPSLIMEVVPILITIFFLIFIYKLKTAQFDSTSFFNS